MYQDAVTPTPPLPAERRPASSLHRILFRKIWLPRAIYTTLPFVYMLLGATAIWSALFIQHWLWIVPYLILIGLAGFHAGVAVLTLRWRASRRARREQAANLPN